MDRRMLLSVILISSKGSSPLACWVFTFWARHLIRPKLSRNSIWHKSHICWWEKSFRHLATVKSFLMALPRRLFVSETKTSAWVHLIKLWRKSGVHDFSRAFFNALGLASEPGSGDTISGCDYDGTMRTWGSHKQRHLSRSSAKLGFSTSSGLRRLLTAENKDGPERRRTDRACDKSSVSLHRPMVLVNSLSMITLWLMVLSVCVPDCQSCYAYAEGIRDPCEDKVCEFGAICVASVDGTSARCQVS